MIIWGSTGKVKTVSRGPFFCPVCRTEAPYTHKRVCRYFTLYFIPLFETQKLGEYVECDMCAGQFDPQVLQMTQAQIEAVTQPWKCGSCGNTNPANRQTCLGCGSPVPTVVRPSDVQPAPTEVRPSDIQ